MRQIAPNLARFVRRLHRRLIVLRLLECAAIGAACAAGVFMVLLPILSWRNKPAVPVVGVLLPLGAAIGSCWLLLRRPRVIDAAGEADRQLNLADLLATAWVIARSRRDGIDPFEEAVLLTADARAAEISPASVVLNRMGVRGWTGVGLTSALAVTLALLAANPLVTEADGPSHVGRRRSIARQVDDARSSAASNAAVSRTAGIALDHPNQEEEGFNPARRMTQVAGEGSEDSASRTEAADPAGAGGGTGTSRAQTGARLEDGGSATARPGPAGFDPSSGVGATGAEDDAVSGRSGLSGAGGPAGRAAPAWTSERWSAARSAATESIRSGAVPARYHDLIRSYFDREEP